jgi:hypothetical protein
MRKISIVGLAFAAIFAFSMCSASSASALEKWVECMEVEHGAGRFSDNHCNKEGGLLNWEILEVTIISAIKSKVIGWILGSGPIKQKCQVIEDGTVGPGKADEITKILNTKEGEITEANPVECEVTEGGSLCTKPATVSPDNLPWNTELATSGGDLLKSSGAGNPGWLLKCANGLENLCTKAETLLSLENLEEELEVALTFNREEVYECTNALAKTGKIEGTASIFLTGTPRALAAR